MPIYTFKNNQTNEEFTTEMKIAERDEFLETNPHIEQLIVSAPAYLGESSMSLNKVPKDFRDYLKRMKKANRKSTIDGGNITEL